ncbi:MAG: MFS transporter, partial [Hyphomicrobiaceae bacterium]
GITQIVAWGTTLYALGVLAGPIAADTGWSRSLVFSGLSVGLLVASLVSTTVGRAIDRYGGRRVMSLGSGVVSIALLLLGLAPNAWMYLAAWALLGLGMRMNLYDAAFAALVEIAPARGRRAISYLTLFGGFASTVFWPIGHALAADFGWRSTFAIFAALNFLICLPLHWWGLARRESADVSGGAPAPAADTPSEPERLLTGRSRTLAMVLFAAVLSACAVAFGALAVHLPALLQAYGLTAAAAVLLASLKGVAQVGGRIWELVWGRNLSALTVGRIAIGVLPLSFAVLMAGGANFWTALMFTLLLGISNGLVTIVRGAVPLALFGRQGYGTVLGILATPYLLMTALAPGVFAVAVDLWDYRTGAAVLLGFAAIAALAMEAMSRWYRAQRGSL